MPSWISIGALLALSGATLQAAEGPPPLFDHSAVPAMRAPSPLPPHWFRGAFMEIFVRAYQDSDGDGIGDLRGLISRLDYLADLGVRGLWLMPVTASADRDHGYATRDYRAIEADYGDLADFDELLRQAHARGIGVIMDYALNHSAAEHPAFVDARQAPGSRYRDWYLWADQAPAGWDIWGKYPWYALATEPWHFSGDLKTLAPPAPDQRGFYFGTFAPQMPDFNLRHPPALAFHLDSLRFWLNRGLDGFRLDAVPHLFENGPVHWNDQPESRALTAQLQALITSYPGRYVVCEATARPAEWAAPEVCGAAFAFGYTQHFVGATRGAAESVEALGLHYLSAPHSLATFVSNHDLFAGRRLWDEVGGDEAAYRLAAGAYLLQPGTPFIYYGEEVGQAGVSGLAGDAPLRAPMSWSAGAHGGFTSGQPFRPLAPNLASHNAERQRADPASLHAFYKAMLALRNQRPSIARGSFEQPFIDGQVLGFQRALDDERTLVLIHYGHEAVELDLPGLAPGQRLRRLYPAAPDTTDTTDTTAAGEPGVQARADADGRLRLRLAPRSLQVLSLPR